MMRGNGLAVLSGALADLAAADEQEPVDTGEGRSQRAGVAVVGDAHLHTRLGQRLRPRGVADDGDHVGGGDARPEQVGDDEAAELPGGAGDGESGHGRCSSGRWGGRWVRWVRWVGSAPGVRWRRRR